MNTSNTPSRQEMEDSHGFNESGASCLNRELFRDDLLANTVNYQRERMDKLKQSKLPSGASSICFSCSESSCGTASTP